MGNILIELEKKDNTTESAKKGFSILFGRTDAKYIFKYIDEITVSDIEWCDVYIAVRPCTPKSFKISNLVKESGRFFGVFYDDDILNIPIFCKWRKKVATKILTNADVFLTTNRLICDSCSGFLKTERIVMVKTPVPADDIYENNYVSDTVNLVYAAGRDHAAVFEQHLLEPLKRLFDEYKDKLHITFVGVAPDMSSIGLRQEYLTYAPLMPLDEYSKFMGSGQFDIGLAPVNDSIFESCKYFNKFIEYSRFGIAGIYSNFSPFTLIVKNGMNGILTDNTDGSWYESIKVLVKNEKFRKDIVLNSQLQLKNEFNVNKITDDFYYQLPEVLSFTCDKAVKKDKNIRQNKLFMFYDKVSKLVSSIKQDGLKKTVMLVKNHIKG